MLRDLLSYAQIAPAVLQARCPGHQHACVVCVLCVVCRWSGARARARCALCTCMYGWQVELHPYNQQPELVRFAQAHGGLP